MVAAGSADTLVAAGMEVHRKDNIVLHLQSKEISSETRAD
jgi:hypothetical protein